MSKKIIIIFVILGFYLSVIAYTDFTKFSVNISQFKIEFLFVTLILNFAVLMLKGFRQQIILKKLDIKIPINSNFLLYLAGLSMLVTPGGTGQIIKSYFLKNRFGIQITKSLPLLLIERFHDLLAMTIIVTLAIIFLQSYNLLILTLIIWIFIILIYVTMRFRAVYEKIQLLLIRFPIIAKRTERISKAYDGIQISSSNAAMIKIWSMSIIAWIIDAVSVYFIFVGFNQDLDFVYTTFVMYSSLLLGLITLLPSGLGVTELSAIGLLTTKGIDISLSTSIIIMVRLTSIWFSTAVGLITIKFFMKRNTIKE